MARSLTLPPDADLTEVVDRPAESEIRAQLDAVLASEQFCTSRRASEFLQHISERALRGEVESLKERLLGIEIFHRRSDYDTSSDAIVRVTANDVRRRLSNFDEAHPRETVRILLPPGSYVPDFVRRAGAAAPRRETTPAQAVRTQPPATMPVPPSAFPTEAPALFAANAPGPVDMEPPIAGVAKAGAAITPRKTATSSRAVELPWVVAIALGALLLGWLGSVGMRALRGERKPEAYAFYRDLLGPIGVQGGEQTEVALSNPHVLLYRGSSAGLPEKQDELASVPVPDSLAGQLNTTANDTQGDFPFHYLQVDDKNYTGLGEAEAAFGLAQVFAAVGRSARLTQARFLNWDAAREQQVVLLGAPHMSAFAQSSLKESAFAMEHDAIQNLHPQAGEQPVYERRLDKAELVDYGLIWMGRSPSGSRVLVLAGLTSTGTAGVGRFFADPVRMRAIYDRLRAMSHTAKCPDSWQVLLRIDAREDVPVRVTPVAIRTLGP